MSANTPTRKPPGGARDPTAKAAASPGAANRTPTSSRASTSTPNGMRRTGSVRSSANGTPVSARAAVRKPGHSSSLSMSSTQADSSGDDSAREEAAAAIQELKERLDKAESEVEEKQKQNEVLKSRLDDALGEQAKLEERVHEEEERVEVLENEKRELTRQHRELEGIYEAERAQTMKEKEAAQAREDELQETIQRLKETMAMKNVQSSDTEDAQLSRSPSFRNNPSRTNSAQTLESNSSFAPPSSIQRSNSRNNSKLIHQKDKIIEGLRLELAEVQIKLVEMENAGGGRMRELEKQLMEARMTNARLMEDNESFQLLLTGQTLNGDLSRGDFLRSSGGGGGGGHVEERAPSRNGPSTSLADELQGLDIHDPADAEIVRRLETEINNLKEQNKALTLYINKIIGRLLTHQGFEAVLGNDDDQAAAAPSSSSSAGPAPNKNKELPPPPPPKGDQENEQPQGFLQRAKSVVGAGTRKPRPASITAPAPANIHEDQHTAPSIPLARSGSTRQPSGSYGHRRSTSDVRPGAASLVNNMVRHPGSGPSSPGFVSPRNSFFGMSIAAAGTNTASNPTSRVPSSGAPQPAGAAIPEDHAVDSAPTPDFDSTHTPSPPRRSDTGSTTAGGSSGGPGIMTGKQMRPLRLVQNEEEAMRARKAANRGSWMAGWFGGGDKDKAGGGAGGQGQGEGNVQ